MTSAISKRVVAVVAGGLILAVSVFPLLYMIRIAFTEPSYYRTPEPQWLAPLFTGSMSTVLSGSFPRSMLNSAVLAVATTIVVLALSSVASHAIARQRSGSLRKNVMFFALTTRMGPAVVFALPLFIMFTNLRLIDTYQAMILVYLFYNMAFSMWLLHGFFQDVPVEIEEAALVDGASPFKVFWSVSLPNVLPGLIATGTLVLIFTWNEFFYALVLTRRTAQTFPTLIPGFFGAFTVEWGQMFAASALGVIPPVILGLLIRRYLTRGLTMGAIQ